MHVSSYLEGFLTVYGWMIYDTMYQLFSMLWVIFLPFLMLFFNFLRDVVTDGSPVGGYAYFKSNLFSFGFMLLVIFTCLVPLDSVTIEGNRFSSVCFSNQPLPEPDNKPFHFNAADEGKIPILPSLVMRMAHGTNKVIYKAIPCVAKVSNLALSFQTSRVQDVGLKEEMANFNQQCYIKAKTRLDNFYGMIGVDSQNRISEAFAKDYLNRLGKGYSYWDQLSDKVTGEEVITKSEAVAFQKAYMGSDLMLYMMNANTGNAGKISAYLNSQELKKWREFVASGKMYSSGPVNGLSSDHPNASENQQSSGLGAVSCSRWWASLKPRLYEDSFKDLTNNLAKSDAATSRCWLVKGLGNAVFAGAANALSSGCQTIVKSAYNMNDSKEFERKMDEVVLNSQYTAENAVLSQNEKNTLGVAGSAAVLGSVLGFVPGIGSNILSNITDSAVSFYGEMFMYKVIAKFLQPMLLMGIFAFWAVYLIVSSYRGETVFKGLVLIFVISLLPGIWAIADHLDGYLYQALFPLNDAKAQTERDSSVIERMVLDGASTVFYVIFPFILLYMISEAGGPRGDRAMTSTDKQSGSIGSRTGGLAGSVTTGAVRQGQAGGSKVGGQMKEYRNAKVKLKG